MPLDTYLLIAGIHAVALISPGPDFAVVTRLSMVSGRRAGILGAAGVSSAIGLYILLCVLGVSLVLAALPWLSQGLAIMGALYLGWLGIQCLRSSGQLPAATDRSPGGRAFLNGFLTNLLNPKAMLYFGSILSQAVTPDLAAGDLALLWAMLVSESLVWFCAIAFLFSSHSVLERLRGRLVWLDRALGVVLLGLAIKVASGASR